MRMSRVRHRRRDRVAVHGERPHLPEDDAMTFRKLGSLSLMLLLGGCGVGGGSTNDRAGAGVVTTTGALRGDDGDDQRDDNDQGNGHGDRDIKHVLLISIDGMHQNDLDSYVANHPSSTLAKLTHSGSEYTNAAA